MLPISHRDFTQSKRWLDRESSEGIKSVISQCFDGISPQDYLARYFMADTAFERKLRIFYSNGQIIGYCLLTFSRVIVDGKSLVCIGASAGFYPEFRHAGQTADYSIREAMKYWAMHPWQRVYYADTMLSPAMYRATAKKVGIVYPHASRDKKENTTPKEVEHLVSHLKSISGLKKVLSEKKKSNHPHLLTVGRRSNYSEAEIDGFKKSEKPEIRFFCEANPKFYQGYALVVVIPVSFKQLLAMIVKRKEK